MTPYNDSGKFPQWKMPNAPIENAEENRLAKAIDAEINQSLPMHTTTPHRRLFLCPGCKPMEFIVGIAVIIQTVLAGMMLWSLHIAKRQLNATEAQFRIEEETRLDPEIECVFNPYTHRFLLRNVGDAPAKNIYLKTLVFCVTSNRVYNLYHYASAVGTVFPPIPGKGILFPGEWGKRQISIRRTGP